MSQDRPDHQTAARRQAMIRRVRTKLAQRKAMLLELGGADLDSLRYRSRLVLLRALADPVIHRSMRHSQFVGGRVVDTLAEIAVSELSGAEIRRLRPKLPKTFLKAMQDDADDVDLRQMLRDATTSHFDRLCTLLVPMLLKKTERAVADLPATNTMRQLSRLAEDLALSSAGEELIMLGYMRDAQCPAIQCLQEVRLLRAINLAEHGAALLDRPRDEVRAALRASSPLIRLGIVHFEGHDPDLNLSQALIDYLRDDEERQFAAHLFSTATAKPVDESQLLIDADERAFLKRLLSKPGKEHILLHGAAGAGKTTLAYSLVHALGLEPLTVIFKPDSKERLSNLACALHYATRNPKAVVIVDEADNLLATGYSVFRGAEQEKAEINAIIDDEGFGSRVIWIANDISRADPSTLRRFSYSLHFPHPSRRERLAIWRSVLADVPAAQEALGAHAEVLAERYELGAGAVASAVAKATALATAPIEIEPLLERCLLSHLEREGRLPPAPADHAFNTEDLTLLSTDHDLPALVGAMRSYVNPAQHGTKPKRLRLLLAGPAGTGKSTFARQAAREIGKELVSLWASGITAQEVISSLHGAERSDTVLLLEGVDSLLMSRAEALKHGVPYQADQILDGIDRFSGTLLCTARSLDHLDPAALHRFTCKVAFTYLCETATKMALFRRYFDNEPHVDAAVLEPLLQPLDLTPADFRVVSDQLLFLKPLEVNVAAIVTALELECKYKRDRTDRRIGFRK